MSKQKILIVDDDNNIAELISLYLTKECYDTKIVNDGEEALHAFEHYNPNLILLDLMLPGIDGYQVCREIRTKSNVPIIMLSAKGEIFDKVLGLELGADDYILKPFDSKELVARVKAVLRRFQPAKTESVVELKCVEYPDLTVNLSNYSVMYNGHAFFENDHPIHIEIGMGKGRFLMDLAALHPEINYIGIERYTSVLLRAVQKMDTLQLPNVHFLCEDAAKLPEIFAPEEVDRIYLNFSDPWPKDRHARRRLTSHEFLDRYDQFLAADGRLEFKTDNQDLFTFSLEEIETSDRWHLNASTRDLHHDPSMNEGNIMTEYEEKFSSKGNPICKLIASR